MLTAEQFAQVCAYMEYSVDESVAGLVEDFAMDEADARELLLTAVRKRQEIDITDVHDELEGDVHGS